MQLARACLSKGEVVSHGEQLGSRNVWPNCGDEMEQLAWHRARELPNLSGVAQGDIDPVKVRGHDEGVVLTAALNVEREIRCPPQSDWQRLIGAARCIADLVTTMTADQKARLLALLTSPG